MIFGKNNTPALASATSANGTARYGTTFAIEKIDLDSLSVLCRGSITTASVAATFSLQVSPDGTNWYNLVPANNAANVATPAGTGTAAAFGFVLPVPASVVRYPYFRVAAMLAGAVTAAADVTQADYYYVQTGGVPRGGSTG